MPELFVAKFGEDILNNGRAQTVDDLKIFSMAVLTLNFDLDLDLSKAGLWRNRYAILLITIANRITAIVLCLKGVVWPKGEVPGALCPMGDWRTCFHHMATTIPYRHILRHAVRP